MSDQTSAEYIADLLRRTEDALRHSDHIQKMLTLYEAEATVIALALVCALNRPDITAIAGTYSEDDQTISWSAHRQNDNDGVFWSLDPDRDELTAEFINHLQSIAHRINVESPFPLRAVFQPKTFTVNVKNGLVVIEAINPDHPRPALVGEVTIDPRTGILQDLTVDVTGTLAAISAVT